MAGRDDGQPVCLVPAGAAAKVGQLNHHGAAMVVALIGKGLHPADNFIFPRKNIVEHRRAVTRHACRPGGHGQRQTGPRALDMIGAVAFLGHPVFRIGRFVACDHQPVLQRQMLELIGLEERIVGHGNLLGVWTTTPQNVHCCQV